MRHRSSRRATVRRRTDESATSSRARAGRTRRGGAASERPTTGEALVAGGGQAGVAFARTTPDT